MDDLDWNERATWERAAEHVSTGAEPDAITPAEDKREGALGELVREYFDLGEEHRLAVTITRANGLPLDDFELKELVRRGDYPFA